LVLGSLWLEQLQDVWIQQQVIIINMQLLMIVHVTG